MALEVISQSKEPEIDRSLWKIILLAILGIGLSILSVYLWSKLILTGSFEYAWGLILSAALFFVVNILGVFFVKSRVKINLILFLESFFPIVLFYDKLYPAPSLTLLLGALVTFVFFALGVSQGIKSLSNGLKIHFWLTARAILPKVVTGFLIFLSVLLYLNYFEWHKFNEDLGKKLFDGALDSGEPILKIVLANVSFGEPLNVFLNKVAEAELRKIKSSELEKVLNFKGDFNSLPPDLKARLLENATNQLEISLEKIFGPLDSGKSVKETAYELLKNYIGKLGSSAEYFLNFGVAFLIFFTLKSIAVLFYWLIIFIAFVFFKLSLVINFSYVTLENRSREFILLS